MEHLGLWIYLCSVLYGVGIVAVLLVIVCIIAIIATYIYMINDECSPLTASKVLKRCMIIGIPCLFIAVLVPSKSTMYQILGVTVATEVVKNSEALQQLPEKSFEALNRFLDSVAQEGEDKSK